MACFGSIHLLRRRVLLGWPFRNQRKRSPMTSSEAYFALRHKRTHIKNGLLVLVLTKPRNWIWEKCWYGLQRSLAACLWPASCPFCSDAIGRFRLIQKTHHSKITGCALLYRYCLLSLFLFLDALLLSFLLGT